MDYQDTKGLYCEIGVSIRYIILGGVSATYEGSDAGKKQITKNEYMCSRLRSPPERDEAERKGRR